MKKVKIVEKKVEEEIITEVTCDNCGLNVRGEDYEYGTVPIASFSYIGGYNSEFPGDLEEVTFDLCEPCLDSLYKSLKYKL